MHEIQHAQLVSEHINSTSKVHHFSYSLAYRAPEDGYYTIYFDCNVKKSRQDCWASARVKCSDFAGYVLDERDPNFDNKTFRWNPERVKILKGHGISCGADIDLWFSEMTQLADGTPGFTWSLTFDTDPANL